MQAFTSLTSIAAPFLQPNVDTEVIIRIDRLIENEPTELGPYCFESLRRRADGSEDPDFILNQPRYRGAQILLVGENFGCGSSREAAVWSLMSFGIRCIVAPSFSDIFYENCLQNGLLPARVAREGIARLAQEIELAPRPQLSVDLAAQRITTPSGTPIEFQIDARRRDGLLKGQDDIDITLQQNADIAAHRLRHRRERPWMYPQADAATPRVLLMAGDGIGPEVMRQTKRVAQWFLDRRRLQIDLREALYGIDSWKVHRAVVTEEAWREVRSADAIVFGASGSPEYAGIPVEHWLPDNLLKMRRELQLYGNLRPVRVLDTMVEFSSLKPEVIRGVDMMIVRELTGGLYFSEPRGVEIAPDGKRRTVNTMAYSAEEVERIARVAFDLARSRRGRVCSVDKANVLEVSELWREVMQSVRDRHYPDIDLQHMYVDNAAMQLVRNPRQFDVMVTENLFGDILSDCAAMIAGSIGMMPSASFGAPRPDGRPQRALYEPIHGSAPDIAGKGIANPIGTILSFGLCLRISLGKPQEAKLLDHAVTNAVRRGARTADIAGDAVTPLSTQAMGDAILAELERLHEAEVGSNAGILV